MASGTTAKTTSMPHQVLASIWLRAAFVLALAGTVGALVAFVSGRSGSAAIAPIIGAGSRTAPALGSADDSGTPVAELAVVRTQRALIRQRPSASADVVCVVPHGTQLLIDVKQSVWCRVRMAEGAGCYVARSEIRLTGVLVRQQAEEPESPGRLDVVAEAQRHLGIPYVWGGSGETGADCSGFVQMVFSRCGTPLPRAAGAQADVGLPVLATELRPGDRIYFRGRSGAIDHTGIYIADGCFIHASGRHDRVVISRLDDPYYAGRYAFARR